MAEAPYTFDQFTADLARFGFKSADQVTMRGLGQRFAAKMREAHPDKSGGNTELAKALNTARDRLKKWDGEGRPRLKGQAEAQPGFADTAEAAQARADARAAQFRKEENDRAARKRLDEEEIENARTALNRIFFWRRWRRRALLPLRGLWWLFAHMPTDRMPWIAGGLFLVFGWPFLQDSSYGRYVPRLPSIYAWASGTEAARALGGQTGPWINRPSWDRSPRSR